MANLEGTVMVDNQHKHISGYRDLSQAEISAMNEVKEMEKQLGHLWREFGDQDTFDVDKRWMAIAKTHFEEGFSAFVRAIAQPEARF